MTAASGADQPGIRDRPEHVVFTAIQQASWARGVAMLDSDVAAFTKRVLEDLLPVVEAHMERAKAEAAAEALEQAADACKQSASSWRNIAARNSAPYAYARWLRNRAAALRDSTGGAR